MNSADIRQAVADLADLFGARTPGDAAMKIWSEALADLDVAALESAFKAWPRNHTRMPSPAEIRKEAMNIASSWLEAEARRNGETNDHGSVRQWVKDTAPELVQKALHLFLSQGKPRHASMNDRLIAECYRKEYRRIEFEVRDGRTVQVERRLEPSLVMVKRAEMLVGGKLTKDNPRVVQALARVKQDEAHEQNAATFAAILANERQKRGIVRQAPAPAQYWNEPF